jgi:hypothetical protein
MPTFSPDEGAIITKCLASLRGYVEARIERPFREKVNLVQVPKAITSLYQQCISVEERIQIAGRSSSDPSIGDYDSPPLKLGILRYRQYLMTILESQKHHTFNDAVLQDLDAQLQPDSALMGQPWFGNCVAERMLRLTDFLTLAAALDVVGRELILPKRQSDEKFGILQAPALLQPDLEYYRANCEIRNASLAIAYVDIDNFKKDFNTPYGETVVDKRSCQAS